MQSWLRLDDPIIRSSRSKTLAPTGAANSTGIKFEGEGEGEWNGRKHGGPKRRVWRKVHLEIDEQTLEVRAVEITGSSIGDARMLLEFLDQFPPDQEIANITADSAFDARHVVEARKKSAG